jgi:acyl-CoA synthetase (AMP-forming)/AMP-acid ligase II
VARHQKGRFTYDELDRHSNALARGLQSISVQKGDRVAVMLGNSLEYASVCGKYDKPNRFSLLTMGCHLVDIRAFQIGSNPGSAQSLLQRKSGCVSIESFGSKSLDH